MFYSVSETPHGQLSKQRGSFQSRFFLHILIITLLGINIGCTDKPAHQTTNLNGFWRSAGYGKILEITPTHFAMYDITKISCVPFKSASRADLSREFDKIELSNTGDVLKVRVGISIYTYHRLDDLPKLCRQTDPQLSAEPEYNFETLWHTFNENYAYFQTRKVDWQQQYSRFRPQINANTKELELFSVMTELLRTIEDEHITLISRGDLDSQVEGGFVMFSSSDFELINLKKDEASKTVAEHYLQNGGKCTPGNLIRWGFLCKEIGYLQVNAMFGFSAPWNKDMIDPDYFEKLIESGETWGKIEDNEYRAVNSHLENIFKELSAADELIIDVRFNRGGFDKVALSIANKLTSNKTIAFTKKARDGEGFTEPQAIELSPDGARYVKPVIVLTSPITSSAAEVFVLSTMALPHVRRVGTSTMGIFSDMTEKQLPNGWSFTLSTEVYESIDGTSYESVGIPPDIEVGYSSDPISFMMEVDWSSREDIAIERALEILRDQISPQN